MALEELARNLCDVKKANGPAPGYARWGKPALVRGPWTAVPARRAAVSGAARGTGKTRPAGLGKILSKSGALAGGYFGDRVNLANRVSGYDRLVLGVPFSRHLRAAAFHSGLPVRYHCGKL